MPAPTLIKDLIDIPERVHRGDFVLRLSEGLERPEETVQTYVVTPQLKSCFDGALSFIKSGIETRSSRAAYLHGSFGAGKSHFMAVLDLILAGNANARSIPELADVIVRHNAWTDGRKFLMVPYHMIGAKDLESAIFGQYAEHVGKLHPGSPVPGFYLAESLFVDAQKLRERMGDDGFFATLNEGRSTRSRGWGQIAAGTWDAACFEAAMLEPPKGTERQRLIGDLVTHFYSSYAHVAEARGESFVSIDDGLAIMSQHAKALGYDAVVLFLDEMILWLATRAADVNFVANEGSKLSKLVESQNPDRPIPLVSFVARQRDLRELVGENLAGALQLQFADVLKYWEARFHKITLEDRNLPVIAEKRILKPKSAGAKQMLDAAFDHVQRTRPEVFKTLLTNAADREMFRQVYPFSPALVQTLTAVSSVLQRERTALKLMLQLLVDRRDELSLGELIPLGDLYNVIAEGDEPFSDATRFYFENAKKLFNYKLLPLLERKHGATWQDVIAGRADAEAARNMRNDARILRTLLLAALVPEVEALKELTGQRLAALNHGTVTAPLAGTEGRLVLTKCREWAAEVGEIKITDDINPVISIQISGIDIDPIVAAARAQDNAGNRRRAIRELLFEALGIQETNDFFTIYPIAWRGSRREVEIIYDNVREMSDDRLRGRSGDCWTVAIDIPFDDPPHTPNDDRARMQRFDGIANTLAWLPSFLSDRAQNDLGRLVILTYLLRGENIEKCAPHLSSVDRAQAIALLSNQFSVLKQRLRDCMRVAYGIDTQPRDAVQSPLDGDSHFYSLDHTFRPRPPVGARLKDAFDQLLDQLLTHRFPAHPQFDAEIRPAALKKVQAILGQAAAIEGGRVGVPDKALRQLIRSIADPLKLGNMGETHFVLGHHWRSHFERLLAAQGGAMTVAKLRAWIDDPQPMGLAKEVGNLVIMTFADQTNRSFFLHGGRITPTLDNLPDELELREEALPAGNDWTKAIGRAQQLFGLVPAETLNAANVGALVTQVRAKANDVKAAIDGLARELPEKLRSYRMDPTKSNRLTTVRSGQALIAALTSAGEDQLVTILANSEIQTSDTALFQTIDKASLLDEILRTTDWELFDAIGNLADQRQIAAEAIITRVGEVLIADEHAIAMKPAINEARRKALELLTIVPPSPPPPLPQPPARTRRSAAVIEQDEKRDLLPEKAKKVLHGIERRLGADPGYRLDIAWTISKGDKGT